MPNKDLVRSERVSVRQRVVDLLAGGAVGRGASSRSAPGACTSLDPLLKNAVSKDHICDTQRT